MWIIPFCNGVVTYSVILLLFSDSQAHSMESKRPYVRLSRLSDTYITQQSTLLASLLLQGEKYTS